MMPVHDLLNKIKWSKEENEEDYSIFYSDRVVRKEIKVECRDIIRLEDEFIVIEGKDEETYIPMHRIRKVKKGEEIIWERASKT